MIAENHYLIPEDRKKSYAQMKKYLLVVTNLEEDNKTMIDPAAERFIRFNKDFDKFTKTMRTSINEDY